MDARRRVRAAVHLGLHEVQKDSKVLHHTAVLGKEPPKGASLGNGFAMIAASAIGTATTFVGAMDQWVARHLALLH